MTTLDEFFAGHERSREIFDAVSRAVEMVGLAGLQISKSLAAFKRHVIFLRAWIPGQYLHGKTAPLVLTFSFPSRDSSPRRKEIVEPAPGRFIHHLEMYSTGDVDNQVRAWIQAAWDAAG